jgi:GTP-binding protein HflX
MRAPKTTAESRDGSREGVLLVGLATRATRRVTAEEHLDELERLVDTAGGVVRGRFVQERSAPDAATWIGKGAVESLAGRIRAEDIDLVVFDDELAPAQARNLEEKWDGARVLDRSGLILDVFALHARSREARTQVELAQLQYLLPRLAGRYKSLSRPGGAIGLRGGGGEQKLELDRRKIRTRIARLRRELSQIETASEVRRKRRRRQPQVAIAGYTNAGKTSLFNRMTGQSAYAADRLFATLDARAGRAASPRLEEVVLLDTVGFVRKLPTSLIASFRSTLAEVRDADLVVNLVDASSPRADEERTVALEVFGELGVDPEKILTVYSKTDLSPAAPRPGLSVSAATGEGIDRLEAEILRRLRPAATAWRLRIPCGDGKTIAAARARLRVLSELLAGETLQMEVEAEPSRMTPFRRFVVRDERGRGGDLGAKKT